jgi:hypothetical protein
MAAWEKFKVENNLERREGDSLAGRSTSSRDTIPCYCSYVIEEINYQLPDGQTEVEFAFFTP